MSTPLNSLVEDMGRVEFVLDFLRDMVRVGGVSRKEQLLAWKLIDEARQKQFAALAVLKARMTEDDRELVERLREEAEAFGGNSDEADDGNVLAKLFNRAADRIIALSISRSESREG